MDQEFVTVVEAAPFAGADLAWAEWLERNRLNDLDPNGRRFDALLLALRARGVGALVISHDLPSILHVPDEVHLLHEGRIHLAGPRGAFVESADPVVQQLSMEGPTGRCRSGDAESRRTR
jgi:ABC-type transporter Mla maintaining outer membrane lipid asymmetry ATPase subunit MlaF